MDDLNREIASAEDAADGSKRALADIRVLDFSWAAAAPIGTKNLADNGATVIRVESRRHPDSVRFTAPFPEDKPGINRSGFYADFNSSKYSIALDFKNDRTRAVVRRLVEWADVVVESFTPRVLKGLDLGYEVLSSWNPKVVMLSSCMQGQTGPFKDYAGYGIQGAALAGLHHITGWSDRLPAGPKGAYTDTIAPKYIVASILAALDYRDRTGKGQYIDLSQVEAAISAFLTTELLDYAVNGRVAGRRGNRVQHCAPYGVFPCQGADRWVSIAVECESQWQGLCAAMSDLEWARQPGFATVADRIKRQDELETHIAEWTSGFEASSLVELLQAHNVPSAIVANASDLFEDPQLRSRGHFWPLQHVEMGLLDYNGPAYALSETPPQLRWAAPLLGEHTEHVMKSILGYSDAEFDEFASQEVFY